ncbi:hypothetical protein ABGB12_03115 [Actinocorallia sp. B10E7]|uniref:hypothetical protein n=1 Tax=Actinocorallia sp. B10E7 TaxID=3153558 RepID=UPI00325E3CB8
MRKKGRMSMMGLISSLVLAFFVAGFAAPANAEIIGPQPLPGNTCPQSYSPYGGIKVDTEGDPLTVTVTAPEGFLISGYCVKAGSAGQGDGPEFYQVVPPQKTVVISHSSGKAVSHYTPQYIPDENGNGTPPKPCHCKCYCKCYCKHYCKKPAPCSEMRMATKAREARSVR